MMKKNISNTTNSVIYPSILEGAVLKVLNQSNKKKLIFQKYKSNDNTLTCCIISCRTIITCFALYYYNKQS